jgi:2-polyprenyl-6-methoxyphenol hydroxylase-like FAD-dependent oxidoreductase
MEFVVTDTKCAVDCQVLIVGAEPVGRVAACDLARQGVSVRVVDAAGVRLDASMLAGVHTDPAERRAKDVSWMMSIIHRGVKWEVPHSFS